MSKNPELSAPKKKLSERKGYIVFKKVRSIFFSVILAVAVLVMIAVMIARLSGNTPSLFGYSVFRVSSGSMSPSYEVGDVIVVKECDPMTLKVGDVVTYYGTSGEFAGKIVTHRVVKAPFKDNGKYFITTKGDANLKEDPNVNVKDVMGKVETKIGLLRVVYNIFITPWGLLIVIALIILAFFNEIVNFVKSLLGIGYEEENRESVEDIIARYQKENKEDKK